MSRCFSWSCGRSRRIWCIHAAAVADGGGFQDIAEVVDFQRQRMLDARIGRVALVVVVDRFARMSEEHGMAIVRPRLQALDREVLFGDGVGVIAVFGRAIQGIDLLPQHRALQGTAGFALLFERQARRQHGIREQQRSGLGVGQPRLAEILALVIGIEQAGEEIGDMVAAEIGAGVEPGLGQHRRHVRGGIDVGGRRQRCRRQ